MKKTPIPATVAARRFGELLARVRFRNEHFVLTKNDRAVAELVPVAGNSTARWGELCRAVEALPIDPAFADDLEAVNRADRPLENPWA